MKAETAEIPDRPERPAAEGGADPVRRVLDQAEPAGTGEPAEPVHVARDATVVHGDDRPGALGQGCLDRVGVDVQRVGRDVDEDRARAGAHEGVRRRHVGEGRHNDLVCGPQVAEECGHLEGGGARGREEDVLQPEPLREEPAAVVGEAPVAGRVAARDGVGDVLELTADEVRAVERNLRRRACADGGAMLV